MRITNHLYRQVYPQHHRDHHDSVGRIRFHAGRRIVAVHSRRRLHLGPRPDRRQGQRRRPGERRRPRGRHGGLEQRGSGRIRGRFNGHEQRGHDRQHNHSSVRQLRRLLGGF